ncbi:MAG: glycosyltransferase family 39 protein, partial [Chloroflexi bacterium]|nr:glycosyltransferase family 39 protein [Chloroflexota bacterium]
MRAALASPVPLLLGLFLLSLSLRLVGLDWDQGALYHPDERRIVDVSSPLRWPESLAEFLDADKSPLNPHFFRYGSLPIYTLSGVASLLSASLGEPVEGFQRALVGRVLSAGFDSLSVLLVYLLGARLYGRRVGLLAALFASLAVLHIQQSHYFVVDIPMTTTVLATLYFSARLAAGGGRWNGALAGLFLGLALATKVSAAPLALPVLLAWALRPGEGGFRTVGSWAGGAVLSGAVASGVFLLTQPYVLLDFPAFLKDVLEESGMASGRADLPYTRQYIATAPYWYHVQQLAVWGLGLPLGILAWLGLVFALGRALWKRSRADLLLLAWVLPFFLLVGPLQAKFARYMLPLAPLLVLFGAVLLWEARDWMARRWRRGTLLAYVAMAAVLVATGAYAAAFLRVYAEPHTATRMAQWARENVPAGSTIAREEWDEAPRDLYPPFQELQLRPYEEPDDEFKLIDFAQRLERADYVLLASQRLYGTIPRLPERYPLTTRYYEKLFNGELGFQVAHVEVSYPNLFGVSLVDDTFVRTGLRPPPGVQAPVSTPFSLDLGFADENYTVYDRPKLILFRKVESLDAEDVQVRLGPAPAQETVFPLLMEPDLAEAQRRGGTWLEIFQPASLANRFAPVPWLLAFEVIALAGLPLGLFVFRALPDKGFLLTKVLAFLIIAYVTWLLASLRWMEFSRASVVAAILLLAFLSLLAARAQWDALRRFFRSHWRLLLTGELLFLSAYAAFVLVRAANPDLWEVYRGGEKPMDFAYLNAV